MSLKKNALSGMFWTFMQQFFSQGIGFIVSIILVRLISPAEFGLIGMITIFISLGTAMIEGGLGTSLIRTKDPDNSDFSTVFFFNLLISILLYFLVFFLAPLVSLFYNQPILTPLIRVYTISFVFNAFSLVQYSILSKEMNFKRQLIISIPSLIIANSIAITLAFLGFGVWSIVWSFLAQSFFSCVFLWYSSTWRPIFIFDKKKFKYHFDFGYKMTLSSIINTIFNNIYFIIIGKYFSPTQVGYFQRADSFKQLPVSNISIILSKVTYPLFVKIQDDDVKLREVYKKIMKMVIYLVAPILLFMSVLAEPLFRLLFSEKWIPAVPYFQILCFNGILYPIHSYNLNILNVKGHSGLFLKLEIIKKILMILIIVISFRFGIMGLIYGSVFFSILAFFVNSHYTGKLLKYNSMQQLSDLLPTIFIALFSSFFVFILDKFLVTQATFDIFRLILGSLLGVICYLFISVMFKMEAYIEMKNIIVQLLNRKK